MLLEVLALGPSAQMHQPHHLCHGACSAAKPAADTSELSTYLSCTCILPWFFLLHLKEQWHACRDPALRIHLLQLLEQVLANEDQVKAFAGPLAEQLASLALLPALVWRAGKAAAAVRFAAITALSTLFAQRLLQGRQLQAMLIGDSLLPMMFQSLEEEYFVDTRLAACSGMYYLLLSAGDTLTYEQCRMIYPELLKRLDDSSNTVRVNVCQALNTFAQRMGPSLDDGNVTYFINGMLIHMDDVDSAVQEAVCSVLESAAIHKPLVVKGAVSKAQHLHRSSTFTNRVLLACTH